MVGSGDAGAGSENGHRPNRDTSDVDATVSVVEINAPARTASPPPWPQPNRALGTFLVPCSPSLSPSRPFFLSDLLRGPSLVLSNWTGQPFLDDPPPVSSFFFCFCFFHVAPPLPSSSYRKIRFGRFRACTLETCVYVCLRSGNPVAKCRKGSA